MLALLLRGFFLLTVVGWYSTSLWRMIDGYFKGQFQRYLEEEYQRNPKMREDVRRGYGEEAAGKPASPLTEKELEQVLRGAELLEHEARFPVGEAEHASGASEESRPNAFAAGAAEEEEEEAIVAEAEKEVDGLEEPTAFREESARERDAEPPDGRGGDGATLMDAIENVTTENSMVDLKEMETQQQQQQQKQSDSQQHENEQEDRKEQQQSQQRERQQLQQKKEQRPKSTKKRKLSGRPQIGAKSEKVASKKRRHEPLTLTDEDFERVNRKKYRYVDEEGNIVDREFSEFENDNSWTSDGDEDEEDEREGMPITDLPYKPAVDIYDLDRLPEEEFCPLTLDDDPSCEETRPWP